MYSERAAILCITPTVKHEGGLERGLFTNCKVQDLEGKLNHTSYHGLLQHHTIPSGMGLVSQGFVLMQDNDPKQTTSKFCQRDIKSKEEQHVIQLMSRLVQSTDLNPFELMLHELD